MQMFFWPSEGTQFCLVLEGHSAKTTLSPSEAEIIHKCSKAIKVVKYYHSERPEFQEFLA